jgi:hypothetical protein
MDLLKTVLDLISTFVIVGGGLWLIWGVVVLAGALKDKNGPQLQGGVWQIVGGALIITAAVLFKTLGPDIGGTATPTPTPTTTMQMVANLVEYILLVG